MSGATALFVGRTDSVPVQLFRNVLATVCTKAVDLGLLVLLTEVAGLRYLVSAVVSYAGVTWLRYRFSTAWVFSVRRFHRRSVEFALFMAVGAAGLGLNTLLLWILTEGAGLHYASSKLAAMVTLVFVGFFVRKRVLFS